MELVAWSVTRRVSLSLVLLVCVLGQGVLADLPWWRSSVVYQIYPRSFADSRGDGNGTLEGILSHADYLKDLGVGVVWVSPIYQSPMKDQGYDVSDFKAVNPIFGNLDDAKKLIKAFHDRGIKFFMDFVPNHSSDEHYWFNASRYRVEPYTDFYVWRDPKGYDAQGNPIPPNNWVSSFISDGKQGSAWSYDKVRKQFYLHAFGDFQPDLNYRNPKVIDATYDNMKFWLDMDADGFRMDAVPYLVEDSDFKDEPLKPNCDAIDCFNHIYTQNVQGTYDVLRDLVNRIKRDYNGTKYMLLEVYATQADTMRYFYGDSSPFNFVLIQNFTQSTNATGLKGEIDTYMAGLKSVQAEDPWPNWVTGNHDNSRVGTRMGADFIDAANMLVLLLPGTSVTFQGEEIGMTDMKLRPESILDCCGRDPERTPFQWDDTINAGFSSSKAGTWLPVNPNYPDVNVKNQSGNATSHLSIYKRLVALRKELVPSPTVNTTTIGDWVLVFKRSNAGKSYYVVINLDNVERNVTLKAAFSELPDSVSIHTASVNAAFKAGDSLVTGKDVTLRPRSGLVLSTSGGAALVSSLGLLLSALLTVAAHRRY